MNIQLTRSYCEGRVSQSALSGNLPFFIAFDYTTFKKVKNHIAPMHRPNPVRVPCSSCYRLRVFREHTHTCWSRVIVCTCVPTWSPRRSPVALPHRLFARCCVQYCRSGCVMASGRGRSKASSIYLRRSSNHRRKRAIYPSVQKSVWLLALAGSMSTLQVGAARRRLRAMETHVVASAEASASGTIAKVCVCVCACV